MKINKTAFLGGLLGGLVAVAVVVFGLGAAWTNAGYEGPAGVAGLITDATVANLIDDYIRDERQEIRYRAEVEHFWGDGDTVTDDNGLHRLGSARCYMSNTAPTELSDSHTGIGGGTIADYLNTAGASFSGEPDLDDPASNSAAGAEDDVGHGRCWIDLDGPDNSAGTLDDNKLYIFIGQAGAGNGAWTAVQAAARPGGDDEILAGAYNLIYNGSFEATDGTGDSTSTTEPEGWTDADADATIRYNIDNDEDYGSGWSVEVTDGGAGNGEILQSVGELASNQVFKLIARAKDDGTTVCTLDVDGEAGAAFTADSTTTDDWETLEGTFGTGAALDDVDVVLRTVTAGQVCLWDHIALYRIDDVDIDRPEVSQPGIQAFYDTYNGTADNVADTFQPVPNLTIDVTPPGPGWVIQVGYTINFESAGVGGTDLIVHCRLDEDGGNIEATHTMFSVDADATGYGQGSLTSVYLNPIPVAGTTLTYTVECTDFGAGQQAQYNDDTESGTSADATSNLWALLMPGR